VARSEIRAPPLTRGTQQYFILSLSPRLITHDEPRVPSSARQVGAPPRRETGWIQETGDLPGISKLSESPAV